MVALGGWGFRKTMNPDSTSARSQSIGMEFACNLVSHRLNSYDFPFSEAFDRIDLAEETSKVTEPGSDTEPGLYFIVDR